MKWSKYLGDKPFWRVTLALAIPVALQNVLTSSFQLVDTMMVSRLGSIALSSVGMAAQWGWLCALLGFGLCSGMSVFISQYWGIKDYKGIRRVLGMGVLTSLVLTVLFLIVARLAPAWVLGLFNEDPDVVAAGCEYLSIVCFSYPAVTLTNVLCTVLRNTERVRLPLYVSIFTTIANAFVDYGLIFGAFGFPEMGIAGAALATCISSWLGPVLILLFSLFEKNLLIGPIRELTAFGLKNLGAFYRRAMPVVFNEGMWALGILIVNMIYSNIGYTCYAVSALNGDGIDALTRDMKGRICLLAGHSGVGKSTLLNRLVPEAHAKTAQVSEAHGTGMHTTTFSELFDLPGEGGGSVIDIPGIKGFGTFNMEREEVAHFFRDIFKLSANCRFGNCTHTHEPGCAVLEALENHQLAPTRYASYLSILEDKEEGKYRAAY